ncbi:hypothetical protein FH972_022301 [Carpinus fangiana]|uniref:Cyclopropane-fatty-acyl-phospholipid synthase n=1 Tax=Carpinus fangiana TaxID=176857 RepID=A0A5N6KSE9_9ROSI|nr:hypothetical protein FH972_022301 [Carpinus fangiana]
MDSLYTHFEGIKRYAGSISWGPLVVLARGATLSVLRQVQEGQLKIVDENDSVTICGQEVPSGDSPHAELKVYKESFWVRMLLFADMVCLHAGLSPSFPPADTAHQGLRRELHARGLARSTNTLANSRLNTSAHYDISNEMFASFLSADMTYSCPIWRSKDDPKHEAESLEHAQRTKLTRFIKNARIQPTDHVLEIGTGWGSLAMAAVLQTGCRVTTITLSKEQKELAEQRIAHANLTDRIEVLLCDYRALPRPKTELGCYDKIVSCEMLEAVGKEFLSTYFECVDKLLKKDGGIAVFQCITIPESVSSPPFLSPKDSPAARDPHEEANRTHPSATTPTRNPPTSSAATSSPAATSRPSRSSSPT